MLNVNQSFADNTALVIGIKISNMILERVTNKSRRLM